MFKIIRFLCILLSGVLAGSWLIRTGNGHLLPQAGNINVPLDFYQTNLKHSKEFQHVRSRIVKTSARELRKGQGLVAKLQRAAFPKRSRRYFFK